MGERVKGKVAVVVGAGSIRPGMGNGKATAILYAREGARVMAVDCNLEAAEETKRLIDEEGGDCITYEADVVCGAEASVIRTVGGSKWKKRKRLRKKDSLLKSRK